MIKKVNHSILEYLHAIKILDDEIALMDHPIFDDDLTLYVLNGLVSGLKEITAPVHAREKSLTFKDLHDLLVGHDNYLHHLELVSPHFWSRQITPIATLSLISTQPLPIMGHLII